MRSGRVFLPPGAVAQVAVYSEHWQPIAMVRRILLRMKSWMNYVRNCGEREHAEPARVSYPYRNASTGSSRAARHDG